MTRKEYYDTWRKKNADRVRENSRKWRLKNRERILPAEREWYKKNRDRLLAYGRQRRAKLRDEIFSLLGESCSGCGFSDRRALQIDHVNGGGRKEYKKGPSQSAGFYVAVIRKIRGGSKEYQTLCANCNWIKRYENDELRRGS